MRSQYLVPTHAPLSNCCRRTVPPRPLALGGVQNVLLWALTADAGEMPKWLCVRNKPLIRGAIFILAPTLGADQIDAIGTGFTKPRTVSLRGSTIRARHKRSRTSFYR